MSEPEGSNAGEEAKTGPTTETERVAKEEEEMEQASEINEDVLGAPSTSNAAVMPAHFPRPRSQQPHSFGASLTGRLSLSLSFAIAASKVDRREGNRS